MYAMELKPSEIELFIIAIIFIVVSQCRLEPEKRAWVLRQNFKGHVERVFKGDKGLPMVQLYSGLVFSIPPDLYDTANWSDYVYKEKESLKYFLVKDTDTMMFYYDMNNKKLREDNIK